MNIYKENFFVNKEKKMGNSKSKTSTKLSRGNVKRVTREADFISHLISTNQKLNSEEKIKIQKILKKSTFTIEKYTDFQDEALKIVEDIEELLLNMLKLRNEDKTILLKFQPSLYFYMIRFFESLKKAKIQMLNYQKKFSISEEKKNIESNIKFSENLRFEGPVSYLFIREISGKVIIPPTKKSPFNTVKIKNLKFELSSAKKVLKSTHPSLEIKNFHVCTNSENFDSYVLNYTEENKKIKYSEIEEFHNQDEISKNILKEKSIIDTISSHGYYFFLNPEGEILTKRTNGSDSIIRFTSIENNRIFNFSEKMKKNFLSFSPNLRYLALMDNFNTIKVCFLAKGNAMCFQFDDRLFEKNFHSIKVLKNEFIAIFGKNGEFKIFQKGEEKKIGNQRLEKFEKSGSGILAIARDRMGEIIGVCCKIRDEIFLRIYKFDEEKFELKGELKLNLGKFGHVKDIQFFDYFDEEGISFLILSSKGEIMMACFDEEGGIVIKPENQNVQGNGKKCFCFGGEKVKVFEFEYGNFEVEEFVIKGK